MYPINGTILMQKVVHDAISTQEKSVYLYAQNIPLQCGHFAAVKYISSRMVGIVVDPLTEVRDGKAGGLTGIRFTPSLSLSQVPN